MYPSNSNEQSSINLPSPRLKTSAVSPNITGNTSAEVLTESIEHGLSQEQPHVSMPTPQMSQSQVQQAPSALNSVNDTTNVVVPTLANDTDLIEKEWVNRAKTIVEKTRDDPYEQSKQLTAFKADYMKKRYNKTIKLSE